MVVEIGVALHTYMLFQKYISEFHFDKNISMQVSVFKCRVKNRLVRELFQLSCDRTVEGRDVDSFLTNTQHSQVTKSS
jgi:hypothetical protein